MVLRFPAPLQVVVAESSQRVNLRSFLWPMCPAAKWQAAESQGGGTPTGHIADFATSAGWNIPLEDGRLGSNSGISGVVHESGFNPLEPS